MSASLDDLNPAFRPTVDQFLPACATAGVPLGIIQTRRTRTEQEKNVANGSSMTMDSRHLTGEAIDVCPKEILARDAERRRVFIAAGGDPKKFKANWEAENPIWWTIGQIGERLGMRWGGRWRKPHDCPHFERCRNGSEDARARSEQATGIRWPKKVPNANPVS